MKFERATIFFIATYFLFSASAAFADVIFVNKNWAQVDIQVRVGNNGSPEANRDEETKRLQKGQSVTIQSNGENVWYRREANPLNHDGHWGGWTNQPAFPNKPPITVNL